MEFGEGGDCLYPLYLQANFRMAEDSNFFILAIEGGQINYRNCGGGLGDKRKEIRYVGRERRNIISTLRSDD